MIGSSGMGSVSLSWTDVHAYSAASGYRLSGWECEQLIVMSRAYLDVNKQATEDKSYPAPYSRELTIDEQRQWREDTINRVMSSAGNIKTVKSAKK